MNDKKLCKSCCKHKQTDNGIHRINAQGHKQFRCSECIKKVKEAHGK